MTGRFAACAAAVIVATLAGSGAVALADHASDKARADQLFSDGRRFLGTKEYAVACAAFEQSQALDPAIGTQLNIALCYEQWGHVASAYRAYVEAERLAKLKFDDRARGARERVDALAAQVPHLRLDLPDDADPATVVVLDGKDLSRAEVANDVLVEIGTHVVEARIPGQQPKRKTFEIKVGEHKRLTIDAPRTVCAVAPAPPGLSQHQLIAGGAFLGVGAIGIAVGIALAADARSNYQDAVNGHCVAGMCDQLGYTGTNDARSRANSMSFVVGGGVAVAAVGVYLLLSGHAEQPAHGVSVAPTFGAGGLGLAVGGSL